MASPDPRRRVACASALAAALLLGAPLAAQDGPAFDCARADSSAETAICNDAALAALDRRLTDRYRAALAAATETGAAAADRLRATQRGWIKGRDDCWKAADLTACIGDAYERRSGELVARWMLEQPQETVFWQCGDTAADELVTLRFVAERPTLRLERGDTIAVAVEQTDAPGVFIGDFGTAFTVTGSTGVLEMPQGARATCTMR